jgi:hypothetical protein
MGSSATRANILARDGRGELAGPHPTRHDASENKRAGSSEGAEEGPCNLTSQVRFAASSICDRIAFA